MSASVVSGACTFAVVTCKLQVIVNIASVMARASVVASVATSTYTNTYVGARTCAYTGAVKTVTCKSHYIVNIASVIAGARVMVCVITSTGTSAYVGARTCDIDRHAPAAAFEVDESGLLHQVRLRRRGRPCHALKTIAIEAVDKRHFGVLHTYMCSRDIGYNLCKLLVIVASHRRARRARQRALVAPRVVVRQPLHSPSRSAQAREPVRLSSTNHRACHRDTYSMYTFVERRA